MRAALRRAPRGYAAVHARTGGAAQQPRARAAFRGGARSTPLRLSAAPHVRTARQRALLLPHPLLRPVGFGLDSFLAEASPSMTSLNYLYYDIRASLLIRQNTIFYLLNFLAKIS